MKKIYVAGAYSANNVIDVLKNIGKGEYYSALLFKMGYAPFCPWHNKSYVISFFGENFNIEMFYDYCMEWLKVSDILFVIPGWEDSKGTIKEIELAKELNIPVIFNLEELKKLGK